MGPIKNVNEGILADIYVKQKKTITTDLRL